MGMIGEMYRLSPGHLHTQTHQWDSAKPPPLTPLPSLPSCTSARAPSQPGLKGILLVRELADLRRNFQQPCLSAKQGRAWVGAACPPHSGQRQIPFALLLFLSLELCPAARVEIKRRVWTCWTSCPCCMLQRSSSWQVGRISHCHCCQMSVQGILTLPGGLRSHIAWELGNSLCTTLTLPLPTKAAPSTPFFQ